MALLGKYDGTLTVLRMDASEWFSEGEPEGVTADLTDAELSTLATTIEEEIHTSADGVVVPHGIDDYLADLRAELRSPMVGLFADK